MNRRNVIKSLALGMFSPADLFNNGRNEEFDLFTTNTEVHDPQQRLWYTYAARYWNSQSMHIGNGFLGLSFLGGVENETIAVTEKSMWTGGPGEVDGYNGGIRPGGKDHVSRIRELIKQNTVESLRQADTLTREHLTGDSQGYGYFSSFGHLQLFSRHDGKPVTKYVRELDLSRATANISYQVDNTKFAREYFCSYPDRIAVLNYSSTQPGSLSLKIKWNCFQKEHRLTYRDNVLELSGAINSNHRSFTLKIDVRNSGGHAYLQGDTLYIEKADNVIFLLSGGTEYSSEAPKYEGNDVQAITDEQIRSARLLSYKALRRRHVDDYKNLYTSVELVIPSGNRWDNEPTDRRWKNYFLHPEEDPALKVLYFNLSRYLLISCSRPGSLPANLQGGWNMFEAAQWSGNYQSNINLQLNYSSACSVNLQDCMLPYIEWIKGLVPSGRQVAKEYYGTDGWVSHSIGNVWGFAAPGFEIEWGMYPAGAAWHCHYLWKYFLYTNDFIYLEETAYPLLKEAAEFWLQNLIEYQGGFISAPSISAEHGALLDDGQLYANGSSYGAAVANVPGNFQDIEMIHELLSNTISAATVLKKDSDFVHHLEITRDKLTPLKIGKHGQLQEWVEDIDSSACNHRHMGHLYAVWPGKQIGADTPLLSEAARVALNLRGAERNYKNDTGKDIYTAGNWSLALRMICWIRLRDAEKANALFSQIITQAGFENLMTFQQITASEKTVHEKQDVEYFKIDEAYWYPVWQVDTSLAIAGFITEMLVQSDGIDQIILLPALPNEWPSGKIKGLKAEGNITVDLEWKDKNIVHYRIYSPVRKHLIVHVNGVEKNIIVDKMFSRG